MKLNLINIIKIVNEEDGSYIQIAPYEEADPALGWLELKQFEENKELARVILEPDAIPLLIRGLENYIK